MQILVLYLLQNNSGHLTQSLYELMSVILVDLENAYFCSTFVLMLLLCGGLGLYAEVHSPI